MKLFGLADGNNFYASCERVFQPKLRGVPIVVLSNNDGCVIARSEEAKALGIEMGAPEFKMRPLMRKHGVRVFSSNYTLYGDMSRRMMETLASSVPSVEVYSIDECFLDLTGMRDVEEQARQIRSKVLRWTGLPICVGMAATKTLAKAANKLAKKTQSGVLHITRDNAEELLTTLPVEKVWGIGRQHTKRLHAQGITNARQLRDADRGWVRNEMGVVGERLVLELGGASCLALDEISPKKKNICCAKSFGHPLTEFNEIAEALACYTNRCGEKLRAENQVATAMSVFLQTNSFRPDQPQYFPQRTETLPEATDYSPALLTSARKILEAIYRPGFLYRKVGVMLLELRESRQLELFESLREPERKARLQATVDQLDGAVRWGSMGTCEAWGLRSEHKSQRYTTCWREVPVAKAA